MPLAQAIHTSVNTAANSPSPGQVRCSAARHEGGAAATANGAAGPRTLRGTHAGLTGSSLVPVRRAVPAQAFLIVRLGVLTPADAGFLVAVLRERRLVFRVRWHTPSSRDLT